MVSSLWAAPEEVRIWQAFPSSPSLAKDSCFQNILFGIAVLGGYGMAGIFSERSRLTFCPHVIPQWSLAYGFDLCMCNYILGSKNNLSQESSKFSLISSFTTFEHICAKTEQALVGRWHSMELGKHFHRWVKVVGLVYC